MKAFLINPHDHSVTEVDHDGELASIYAHTRCDCICALNLDHGDAIMLDDEGLYKPRQAFFAINDYPHPCAGFGLVVGSDRHGETVAPRITLAQLQQAVRFLTPKDAQLMHYQAQARAAKWARMVECDNRNAFVVITRPVDFPQED